MAAPHARGAIDFKSRILPVFEKKCFDCHGAPREEGGEVKSPRAGLRLDSAKGILRGGEGGAVISPGSPDDSVLFQMVSQRSSHDDFMPKEGDGLGPLEKLYLKKWIAEGAVFDGWIGNEEGLGDASAAPSGSKAKDAGAPGEGAQVAMVPKKTPETTPVPAMKDPPRAMKGTPATVNFQREVLPFLKRSCVDCHRAPYEEGGRVKKPKAGLRFDAARAIIQGSGEGPVLVPGDPDESEMLARVSLPEDDDDFMPPDGDATPLSAAEKEVLKRWIAEGADFGGWVGNEEGLIERLPEAPTSSEPSAAELLAKQVKGASAQDLAAVTATGASITQVAVGNPLLRVEYITGESAVTDADVAKIGAIAGNVTELDLSETGVSDEGLAMLSGFDKLTYLDLHNTAITDVTIDHIQKLGYLEYLNLYGTSVSDASLPKIAKLRKLKAVYLWKTSVTEEGAGKLRQALRDAKISF